MLLLFFSIESYLSSLRRPSTVSPHAQLTMTSRLPPPAWNRSFQRKPSAKAKPPDLRGNSIDHSDQDYLKDNLLGGDEDELSSPTFRAPESPKLPPQRGTHDVGSSRLVIGIDYGTTFTGKRYLVTLEFS